jgi:hypothetical protein
MSARTRLLLGLAALILVLIAVLALAYALSSAPVEHLTAPVTPTLLAPPAGAP